MKEKIESWWRNTPFVVMENVTGYRQDDFSPEDGYQEFVDACDNYWNSLSFEDKRSIYLDWN